MTDPKLPTKEELEKLYKILDGAPPLQIEGGEAVEDENGVVHLVDKAGVSRVMMPKDVWDDLRKGKP